MARDTQLTEESKEFLRKTIAQYESFAAITADDAESRAIRAEGLARVGIMRYRLGEMKEAEAAMVDALALQAKLAADFPSRPEFRHELARSHNNRGLVLLDTNRLKEAETAFSAALALHMQLAAEFPERPDVVDDVARVLATRGESAAEQMNDSHSFRRHALGRLINIQQQIHIAALAENNVLIHAQVAGVRSLCLCRKGRKSHKRRNCHERPGCLYKTASVDLLHLVVASPEISPAK